MKVKLLFITLTAAIVTMAGVLYFHPPVKAAFSSLLTSADIAPRPVPFTELYFENTSSLPRQTRMDQVYSFSFTVRNLENRPMDYTYAVYLQKDGRRIELASQPFSLANDQIRTVTARFSPYATDSSEIIVELTNLSQSIHFWTKAI